jgi:hypothetical protein
MSSLRTVWILGAGFSQALGAPLFKDLFGSDERISTSGLNLPGEPLGVLSLYRSFGPVREGRGQLWRDPEEFIDVIETARDATSGARRLLEGSYRGIRAFIGVGDRREFTPMIADVARRLLAVECSLFLRGADPKTERWLPYRRWAPRLTKDDTIVTFNYDRVFELLKENCPTEAAHYRVVVPDGTAQSEISDARSLNCAPILKLHGSVDWIAKDGRIRADPSEDLPATCANGEDLVLAVPGPDKIGVRDRFTDFTVLWSNAREALKYSARVVFIGYRFPQTDAQARVEILTAIKEASANGLVKVWIVLGPDDKHPDVARMLKLLRFVCPERVEVSVLPLYAEDFLSLGGIAPNLF